MCVCMCVCVCVCVCMCVCMYVIRNKKNVLNRFEKFFFSCKGMDRVSNMGYIRSFTHNAELQETRKIVKKQGFSAIVGIVKVPYHKSRERVDGFQKFISAVCRYTLYEGQV